MSDDRPTEDEADAPPGGLRMVLKLARELALLVVALVPIMMLAGWMRAPSLPDQAPGFALVDLAGNRVALDDFRGQTVVVNFWATWCGPCRMEAPGFAAFAEAHPDVPVIGVVADGPPEKVRAVAKKLGITYTVVSGDKQTFNAYGVSSFPTTVIVNPDGSVRWAHVGAMFRPQLALLTGKLW